MRIAEREREWEAASPIGASTAASLGVPAQRVVWIVDALKLGGAERLALRFLQEALPASGAPWRVELVALQPPPGGRRLEEIWGAEAIRKTGPIRQLGMRHLADAANWWRLVRLLRGWRPALVHSHLRYATVWAAAAAGVLGVPHVTTVHLGPPALAGAAAEPSRRQRWVAGLELAARRRAARVIYVSEAQRAAWEKAAGRTPQRGLVIGNGVAVSPSAVRAGARAQERRRRGIPAEAFVFVTVAVVRARKGWRAWLEAIERIAPRRPEAWFVWVGGGSEHEALRAAAGASRWAGRILLAGPQSEVGEWLGLSDVFLFPSEEEAQPTAVMEAMAAGLAVIASDLPAIAEVLGNCGARVGVGDAAGLAEAAVDWSAPEASGRRAAAGEAARRRIAEKYGEAAWREKLLRLYAEVLEERGRGRNQPWAGRRVGF